jgi:phage gp36-like protein
MQYATISDLIKRFGGREIGEVLDSFEVRDVILTAENIESDFPEAKDELDEALKDAQAMVESVVSQVYVTPLQLDDEELETAPDLLRSITCDIARYYLHDDKTITEGATDPVLSRYQKALEQLDKIRSGELVISADYLYESDDTLYHV